MPLCKCAICVPERKNTSRAPRRAVELFFFVRENTRVSPSFSLPASFFFKKNKRTGVSFWNSRYDCKHRFGNIRSIALIFGFALVFVFTVQWVGAKNIGKGTETNQNFGRQMVNSTEKWEKKEHFGVKYQTKRAFLIRSFYDILSIFGGKK